MHRRRNLFAFAIVSFFVVWAVVISQPTQDERAAEIVCREYYNLEVIGLNGEVVYSYSPGEFTSKFEWVPENGAFYRFADQGAWQEFHDEVNYSIGLVNNQLVQLYNPGTSPEMFIDPIPFQSNTPVDSEGVLDFSGGERTVCPPEDRSIIIRVPIQETCPEFFDDFCTTTTLTDGDYRAFVKVQTSGGSSVSYSYPAHWLDSILVEAFNDNLPSPYLEAANELSYPKIEEQEEAFILWTLNNSNVEEIGTCALNLQDFQGRKLLEPIIRMAAEVAAIEDPRASYKVAWTLHEGLLIGSIFETR